MGLSARNVAKVGGGTGKWDELGLSYVPIFLTIQYTGDTGGFMQFIRFIAFSALLFCSACSVRLRTAPEQRVSSELAPMDYLVHPWVESKVCSGYIFYIRFREDRVKEKVAGKRDGVLSRGSVLGGRPPDPDSSDALYGAIVQFPTSSFLLVPRYNIQSSGFVPFGTRPVFGRRCSLASTRGVEVKSRPATAHP